MENPALMYSPKIGLCGLGHQILPGSRATDGVATEYCPTCHVESITTLHGVHHYDQRERLESKLSKDLRRDLSPPNPSYQRTRTMRSLDV